MDSWLTNGSEKGALKRPLGKKVKDKARGFSKLRV